VPASVRQSEVEIQSKMPAKGRQMKSATLFKGIQKKKLNHIAEKSREEDPSGEEVDEDAKTVKIGC
jgi:hypothetical protein